MNPHLLDTLRLRSTRLKVCPDPGDLLGRLSERRGLVALDSAAGEPREWSWFAFDPLEVAPLPACLGGLQSWLEGLPPLDSEAVPGPFGGGFIGALAYDQGVHGERLALPVDPWNGPGIVGGCYTNFFVLNHLKGEAHLVLDSSRESEREELIEQVSSTRTAYSGRFRSRGELRRQVDSATHRARIEAARELIGAGEIYQANLAHPFEVETEGDPLALYLRLRDLNPAPYMAYLRWDEGALLSASPELLLESDGDRLRSRPIKGTAPRSADPVEDARLGVELMRSAKDRAELAMLVDLLRNDLGSVASTGSVEVKGFPALRSYAGVHHLMADVVARLSDNHGTLDALASVFPGGSITGAPKLRAMEVIGQLEERGRGFFTGSLGFVDRAGRARFNILIRTMQWRSTEGAFGQLRYHVGGGITWGSDPHAEDRETLIKGAKLAEALGFPGDLGR
jgi:para-aminobenzoate synthetase component I